MSREPGKSGLAGQRLVAVHKDAVQAIRAWSQSEAHKAEVPKFLAMMMALFEDDQNLVQAQLRRNSVESVRGCKGLVELGPKKKKGGAPRLFLFRQGAAAWFVAAGLEKGSGGVAELAPAKQRSEALRDEDPPKGAYTSSPWQGVWYVFTAPGQLRSIQAEARE